MRTQSLRQRNALSISTHNSSAVNSKQQIIIRYRQNINMFIAKMIQFICRYLFQITRPLKTKTYLNWPISYHRCFWRYITEVLCDWQKMLVATLFPFAALKYDASSLVLLTHNPYKPKHIRANFTVVKLEYFKCHRYRFCNNNLRIMLYYCFLEQWYSISKIFLNTTRKGIHMIAIIIWKYYCINPISFWFFFVWNLT